MKPSKRQLIAKENRRESAIKIFKGTNITMVNSFRVLGLVIRTPSACDKNMENEIEKTATLTEKPSKKLKHHGKTRTPATQREFKKIKLSIQSNSGSILENE